MPNTTTARIDYIRGIASRLGPGDPGTWARMLHDCIARIDELEKQATDTTPIALRWDRLVIHPNVPSEDDTIVCCTVMGDGRPAALFLDDEHREALGLQLVDPDGDEEQPTCTAEYGGPGYTRCSLPAHADNVRHEAQIGSLRRVQWGGDLELGQTVTTGGPQ